MNINLNEWKKCENAWVYPFCLLLVALGTQASALLDLAAKIEFSHLPFWTNLV